MKRLSMHGLRKSISEDWKIKFTINIKATDLFLQMVVVITTTVDVISQENRGTIYSHSVWSSLSSIHSLLKSNNY